ncbi:MAG: 4Fe-4S dicluster domain-containing protein [Thermoplasmatales archaeon]|nr:4Fe-4S dicluster domain-containing protein [Thermoplasmatales archaeon]
MYSYEKTGILSKKDLKLPSKKQLEKGVAIIECVQEIPCNPCVDSCPVNAISMKDVNAPPIADYDKCIGCGKCIGICPGLAIFLTKIKDNKALITLQYEFLPIPEVETKVKALDREGNVVGKAIVKKVVKEGKTMVIAIEASADLAMDIRNIRVDS